jgi:hypothetical protein
MKPALLALCVFGLACSGSDEPLDEVAAERPEELARRLQASAAELAARPEHDAERVRVQHLLVGVAHERLSKVARTRAEAEALAAQLFARAKLGEDFDTLVRNHTDDSYPGVYTLSREPSSEPEVLPRATMFPAFGDAAWRLAVGELGVALYDGGVAGERARCPWGYELLLRLE